MEDARRRITTDSPIAGVNIVPVIDLCLVLLVILLIISPLLDKPPVEVTLPKARTVEQKENNIAVTVAPDGRVAVNSDRVERGNLKGFVKALLKEQGADTLVILRSDENDTYANLTELIREIKDAGATNIAIGTQEDKSTTLDEAQP
jgi:biopolymer transport protein ExbD